MKLSTAFQRCYEDYTTLSTSLTIILSGMVVCSHSHTIRRLYGVYRSLSRRLRRMRHPFLTVAHTFPSESSTLNVLFVFATIVNYPRNGETSTIHALNQSSSPISTSASSPGGFSNS